MIALIAGLAAFAGLQAPSPEFRAEVYVVPVEFSVSTSYAFGLVKKPYTDLTKDDVSVVLDKKAYPAVELTQDPKKPGHYLVSFTPAPEYRDGAKHLVEVSIKLKRFRSPMTMPETITIPKQTNAP